MTVTHLMPSPYKTKCEDYNKIGCKSRRDCVDRCNVEWTSKNCNESLSVENTFTDKHDDKDIFTDQCNDYYKENCQQRYKPPDCINQYYAIKLLNRKKIKELASEKIVIHHYLKSFNKTFKSNNKNAKPDINLMSVIYIDFNNEPDTIYIHSPQQYPIEFICLIGGVISLWTGFSVVSLYAFGKRIINRKPNKIEAIKVNVVNNKKMASINKKNGKISSLETKLNKVMKFVRILKKKNPVIKVTPNNNV